MDFITYSSFSVGIATEETLVEGNQKFDHVVSCSVPRMYFASEADALQMKSKIQDFFHSLIRKEEHVER
jgi:hypothetical protein